MGGDIVRLIEQFGGKIGDSYQLALMAADHPEKSVIIESAVHFMAESIRILANDAQQVFITNPKSGCTMEMFAKDVVGGGTGSYYSADNIFILGRQQEKDGTEVTGYNFIINVEKSRYVREKSKIPVTVLHDGGINKWSGLLDIALESKHVIKPKAGWYQRVDEDGVVEEKSYREKDTNSSAFWLPILKQKSFQTFVEEKYCVAQGSIMQDEVDETFDVETTNGE